VIQPDLRPRSAAALVSTLDLILHEPA